MKQLTVGLIILLLGMVALLLLSRNPLTKPTENTITATVIANTLTQSLDGHRRYLTLEHPTIGVFRVGIPPTTQCPMGYFASLQELKNQMTQKLSYQFIRCLPSLENGKS